MLLLFKFKNKKQENGKKSIRKKGRQQCKILPPNN